jgi:2-polyprenyl-3-methyl-5-hydroxy-6-metoxy-1,4-benzoquinol methylase
MRNLNAEHSDSAARKYAYRFDYLMHDYMMQTFQPFIAGDKALELGCYKGEFTKRLSELFSQLVVIEGAAQLIAEARDRVASPAVRFLLGNFEDIDLNEQFDAIFLIHTLEHLDHPEVVLKRIQRWLAPQGKLFLAVPNAHAASRQIAVKMELISHASAVTTGEYAHGHRRTYSLDTLENEVRSAGLSIVSRGGILFKPLANFQFDQALEAGIVDKDYLDGCYRLGMVYPDLCASIYLVCGKASS